MTVKNVCYRVDSNITFLWQFVRGDTVEIRHLIDRHVVAKGEVSGLPGEDTFHSVPIESPWVRVLVKKVIVKEIPLPMPNKEEKQEFLGDVKGLNALWNARFLRKC